MSPVVGIVVTGLVAAGAAAASLLAGADPAAAAKVSVRHAVWPLAVLIIGIVGGTIAGVRCKVSQCLAPSVPPIEQTVARWAALTGLSSQEIARRLFSESPSMQIVTGGSGAIRGHDAVVSSPSIGGQEYMTGAGAYIMTTSRMPNRADSLKFSQYFDSLARAYRPKDSSRVQPTKQP